MMHGQKNIKLNSCKWFVLYSNNQFRHTKDKNEEHFFSWY